MQRRIKETRKASRASVIWFNNMTVNIGNHINLSMSRVSLYRFNVSSVQLQFVRNTRMTQAVEDYLWKIILLSKLL